MNDHSASGGCYCGDIGFKITKEGAKAVNCHCGMCRRLSGAAYTTWVSVQERNFRLTGSRPSAFAPSRNATRHFCPRCGTHVFTRDARYPDTVALPAGVISGFDPAVQAHYFVSHRASWHLIEDELPCFGGESGFEPLQD
jgi:hypothetical protein